MSTIDKKEKFTKAEKKEKGEKEKKEPKPELKIEDVFAAIAASKMEISFNKVKTVADYVEHNTKALEAIDRALEKMQKQFGKLSLKKLIDYKATIRTNEEIKGVFSAMMTKIFTIYGVNTHDTFWLDVTGHGKVNDRMAKILFIRMKKEKDEGVDSESD